MPSFSKALDLWRHDRALFYRRLKSNLVRSIDTSLSFIPGKRSLYSDFLPGPPQTVSGPRCLIVFSCNPFLPSGVGASILAQCSLLVEMGYVLDALFYVQDELSRASREALLRHFDRVAVVFPKTSRQSRLDDGVTATNLDEWCGGELLDACAQMLKNGHYAAVMVHQPWLSKVLELVPEGIKKYLFMHDNFAGRAALFEKQGLPRRLAWLNLSDKEQARCMLRADIIFAVQDEEKTIFEQQTNAERQVVTVKIPFSDNTAFSLPRRRGKLAVGIIASANENNRHAVIDFVRLWEREPLLCGRAELRIAGDVGCFVSTHEPSVYVLGRVERLDSFYADLDVVVNPDCSGTGIKVKSLEALSFGRPLLCSLAGSAGLHSTCFWHNLLDRPAMVASVISLIQQPALLHSLRDTSIALFRKYNDMEEYIRTLRPKKV